MIKQDHGSFFVKLLVVTGLAGTIKDNSLSKKERKFSLF